MKDFTFNYIWKEVIVKAIDDVEDGIKQSVDGTVIEKCHFKKRKLSYLKREVNRSYEEIRDFLKENYYDTSKKMKDPQNRIDNHKMAACICYSLIQNKVFSFDVLNDMPQKIFVSNYEVAYTVSLGFVYTTLLAQYRRKNKFKYADKLEEQGKLLVPRTSPGHDEYHDGRIHTLALNDLYGNTFDLLTYSDMMFWIEYYNRQKLEGVLEPMILWDLG